LLSKYGYFDAVLLDAFGYLVGPDKAREQYSHMLLWVTVFCDWHRALPKRRMPDQSTGLENIPRGKPQGSLATTSYSPTFRTRRCRARRKRMRAAPNHQGQLPVGRIFEMWARTIHFWLTLPWTRKLGDGS